MNQYNLFENNINNYFFAKKNYKYKNVKFNFLSFNYFYLIFLLDQNFLKSPCFIKNFLFVNKIYQKMFLNKKNMLIDNLSDNNSLICFENYLNETEIKIFKKYFNFKENKTLINYFVNLFKFKNNNFIYFSLLLLLLAFFKTKLNKNSIEEVKNYLYLTAKFNSIILKLDAKNFNFWIKKNQFFFKV